MTVNGPVSVLDFHAQHAVEINGVKFIPLEAARQEIERLQTALRAAHAAGRAEGGAELDSLRARLAYAQGGSEQIAALSAWLAASTVREVVIGRTKDGSGMRAQAQVWEGAGRVEAECVGEDVALALEALGRALK